MEIKRLTKEELQDFTRLKGCKIEKISRRILVTSVVS